ELVRLLGLAPHPEGGWYAELFRSPRAVQPQDGRPPRAALTSIDFLLAAGQHSAWHRVASDEVWHLLEGGPLRLWLASPALDAVNALELGPAGGPGAAPRQVVPAGWWQAAEPLGEYAWAGATVGPGFEFDDFAFGRDDAPLRRALQARWPELQRLL
ncbi:MAG: cupin domain-containing protein, partial [Burkholderiales bacterium]|nr:cupin domain-containing protein [Burkholderiales bacterium]